MSDRAFLVYADLAGVAHFIGRLWARRARNRESATFEYDVRWLASPARFALEPALMLGGGPQHTPNGRALFGAFGDSAPDRDCAQLWRRIVFNILISNTDDHLRNHGFLFDGVGGWRLSPAYDMNPTPLDVKARVLSLAIDEADDTAALDVALGMAHSCGLKQSAAKEIIGEVQTAVAQWRVCAATYGLTVRDIGRMASAFEYQRDVR